MSTPDLFTDDYLVTRLKEGDDRSFEIIYQKYHRQLYFIAYKYLKNQSLAEDAVQDVFLKLWLRREQLDEKLSIKGLLFTSLKNYVLNAVRNRQTELLKQAEIRCLMPPYQDSTENTVALTDYTAVAQAGIEKLSPQKKRIFQMRSFDGLSNDEVADQLGISINTVKFQFSKATKLLRDYLKKHAGIRSVSLLFLLHFFQ